MKAFKGTRAVYVPAIALVKIPVFGCESALERFRLRGF
jgi:hypothetical protein